MTGGAADIGVFLEVLNFAALRHRHQRRKGRAGAPYVNHLIEVAHLLASHRVEDPEILCAAILHDAVEDAEVTLTEIEGRFGGRVARIVRELTDDPTLPVWQRKVAQVEGASSLSEDAQHVRVADKISNLRGVLTSPPERWSLERKLAYYGWAAQVVAGCVRADRGLLETFSQVHESGMTALQLERLAARRRGGGGDASS